ncbi:hypothetical protein CXG81DRAFT_28779 [Caulochytrium protostelioides]|uniref:PH domain-containing protein n=1 Tax=Caulochytrium protostelioides TaxID=1555241 RepID=A0A4P9WY78_9FUNG|nr:hypothetical protein CXG81DRAFT_28779 [Caulochytrium protostelioides]|eukprot:RKO98384.1 hypothetical protein CXG81DRAFT_28779 [Caulochytrium protostelioides]
MLSQRHPAAGPTGAGAGAGAGASPTQRRIDPRHLAAMAQEAAVTAPGGSPAPRLIKQGWVYKKGGSGLFASWKLKFLVLSPTTLQIYNQMDQSRAPRYEIALKHARFFVPQAASDAAASVGAGTATATTAASPTRSLLGPSGTSQKRQACAFGIQTRSKRFDFAAQTRSDREEWITVLQAIMSGELEGLPAPRRRGRGRGRGRAGDDGDGEADDGDHDDDAYSDDDDDDTRSVISTATRRSVSRSPSRGRGDSDGEADGGRGGSGVVDAGVLPPMHALAFCTEPVLTPDELQIMHGHGHAAAGRGRGRRSTITGPTGFAPAALEAGFAAPTGTFWHDVYHAILDRPCVTPDDHMQKDADLVDVMGRFRERAERLTQRWVERFHQMAPRDAAAPWAADGMVLRAVCDYHALAADEAAVQAAIVASDAELRGINAVCRVRDPDGRLLLHPLLRAHVDYRGFRVVALAQTPALGGAGGAFPLVLDAAAGVLDPEAAARVAAVGERLHLAPRAVAVPDGSRHLRGAATAIRVWADRSRHRYYCDRLDRLFPRRMDTTLSVGESGGGPASLPRGFLRPEFLLRYQQPLCADWDAAGDDGWGPGEAAAAAGQVRQAQKCLEQSVLPSFVKKLDAYELRPVDAHDLRADLHKAGINMAYLGQLASLTPLPHVRHLCVIDMIARAAKRILRARLRAAYLHFHAIGATHVEDELRNGAAAVVASVCAASPTAHGERFFADVLAPTVLQQFGYRLEWPLFLRLHRPALLHALEYHCHVAYASLRRAPAPSSPPGAVSWTDALLTAAAPTLTVHSTIPDGVPHAVAAGTDATHALAYAMARHFKSLGPAGKLQPSAGSAVALLRIATHYHRTGRYEEGRVYAQAAMATAPPASPWAGLARAAVLQALGGLEVAPGVPPSPSVVALYDAALTTLRWAHGSDHPALMTLHDRMSDLYAAAEQWPQALALHAQSLQLASTSLGKTHPIMTVYLTHAGVLHAKQGQMEQALACLTEALHVHAAIGGPPEHEAEIHYQFAELLPGYGDLPQAIHHARKAQQLRERAFGQQDPRTVVSYLQTADLVVLPFAQYAGVLTQAMHTAYREAISFYEKVFRFLKVDLSGSSAGGSGGLGSPSRAMTTVGPAAASRRRTGSVCGSPARDRGGAAALVGAGPSASSLEAPPPLCLRPSGLAAFSSTHRTFVGPLRAFPLASAPVPTRASLHRLTRLIVRMKLALVEDVHHRDVIRTLRLAVIGADAGEAAAPAAATTPVAGGAASAGGGGGLGGGHGHVAVPTPSAREVREVIFRLAAVSPSIYMDGLLSRLSEDDPTAADELAIVLMLTERETLGVQPS